MRAFDPAETAQREDPSTWGRTGIEVDGVREAPVRLVGGVDMSHQDVPYLVVPAFTDQCLLHVAVECEGVVWNRESSIRVIVRTRCGKSDVHADRRCFVWTRKCRRCFPGRLS